MRRQIMTKIKICGLTEEKEAEYLNRNNVDFAGFVMFYPKSKRNVSIEQAKKIMAVLDNSIKSVAVTVSPDKNEITEIENAGFDYIQIHGEISDELIESAKIPVLRAFNVKDIDNYEHCVSLGNIAGYVFDAQEPGSGKTFDWSAVKSLPSDGRLIILAGGLNPDNVEEAVKYLNPDCVDVSSGVENDVGTGKDINKINLFAERVRAADKKYDEFVFLKNI